MTRKAATLKTKTPKTLALSRRTQLKLGLGALAGYGLSGTRIFSQSDAGANDHFFLHVVISGGLDHSYFFDARPRSFTAIGKMQNYSPAGEDPQTWQDGAGREVLCGSASEPLRNQKDYFSVVKGVVMGFDFDGHSENLNLAMTGSPFGGKYFAQLTEAGRGSAIVDVVQFEEPPGVRFTNSKNILPMTESLYKALRDSSNIGGRLPDSPARKALASLYQQAALLDPQGIFSWAPRVFPGEFGQPNHCKNA